MHNPHTHIVTHTHMLTEMFEPNPICHACNESQLDPFGLSVSIDPAMRHLNDEGMKSQRGGRG